MAEQPDLDRAAGASSTTSRSGCSSSARPRTAASIFALLDGFRAFADWLVTTANDAMLWMTWVGTLAAAVLIVLALRRLARRR